MRGARLRHAAGLAAEEAAARAYLARGARILARRWRCRGGEIDLVLREGGAIVFVEVRARADPARAALSITPRKRARLAAAAQAWLNAAGLSPDSAVRLDAALFDRHGEVTIIENIGL
ncbi:MAG: hypothetical protein KatS3mg118_1735 [Paracoccaceae bacterium]|nr:MAG: hypothetical protein KatS3mg118_1735 [Paracoccaceae bacterium]